MLESYFEEVTRRRRQKNFFWILVFLGATTLYFFFKGYYVSLNIDWKNIFSESGAVFTNTGQDIASINSFGIIHIKSSPNDANIILNNHKKISNGEKFFTDYGQYLLEISRDGYKTGKMDFTINAESNFYIDNISLLKNPHYSPLETLNDSKIIRIGENTWIGHSSSGMLLFQDNFDTGTIIGDGKIFDHIGENKFLSGNTIIEYNTFTKEWIRKSNSATEKFIKGCPTARYQKGLLYCYIHKNAITESGKILTGIIAHSADFVQFEDTILLGDFSHSNTKTFSLSGQTLGNVFLEIDGDWYTNSGGTLLPLSLDKKNNLPEIFETNLESIDFMNKIGNTYFFLGKKENQNFLTIINPNGQHKSRTLDFPDIEISEVRIYEKNQNFFIKTKNALLFLYGEGNEIQWLIEGKILATGNNFALYEKDGKIWKADWNPKNISS